jgi:parallel beta-helix repeat protein
MNGYRANLTLLSALVFLSAGCGDSKSGDAKTDSTPVDTIADTSQQEDTSPPKECTDSNEGAACDDGDNATKTDLCDGSGGCAGTPYSCAPGQCEASSTPNGTDCAVVYQGTSVACDDGDNATKTDLCDGSGGCAGAPYSCAPAQCEASSTPNGTDCAVVYQGASVACDDGDNATKIDLCDGSGGCAGTETLAPYPSLPVVHVLDGNKDKVLNQADIDDALVQCGTGCNLHFTSDTYVDVQMEIGSFPDGFAMYGDGYGVTVLRGRVFTDVFWEETLVVGSDAPDGVIIQDMSFDGRILDQDPFLLYDASWEPIQPLNQLSHHGIVSKAPNLDLREDGIIRRVEVHDYASWGIGLRESPGWVVSDSIVYNMGCHVVDVPCGPGWELLPDVLPTTPGRKLDGYGIEVLQNSDSVVVKNNQVSSVTKIGIQVYGEDSCDPKGNTPRGTTIENNVVTSSAGGIVLNGACEPTVIGNIVTGSIATGGEAYNLGNGFSCAGKTANDLVMRDNVSTGNQLAGYNIACIGGNITFQNNVADDNCQGNSNKGDFDFGRSASATTLGEGLTITGATNLTPSNCFASMYVHGWNDVTITDSTLQSDQAHGLRVEYGSGIDVRTTTITGTGNNDARGVIIGNNLADTYVHPSVSVTGFATEVEFYSGSLDDGDHVAYCALESSPPAGCDPP